MDPGSVVHALAFTLLAIELPILWDEISSRLYGLSTHVHIGSLRIETLDLSAYSQLLPVARQDPPRRGEATGKPARV